MHLSQHPHLRFFLDFLSLFWFVFWPSKETRDGEENMFYNNGLVYLLALKAANGLINPQIRNFFAAFKINRLLTLSIFLMDQST